MLTKSKRYTYSGSVQEWNTVSLIREFELSVFKLSVRDCIVNIPFLKEMQDKKWQDLRRRQLFSKYELMEETFSNMFFSPNKDDI